MPKNTPAPMRQRIARLMKQRRMTQAALAEAIGASESTVYRYLSGQVRNLTGENLAAIARALGVTADYLLGLTDLPLSVSDDIRALHLSVGAAQRLCSGEVDGELVSILIEHRDFPALVEQIARAREITVSAAAAALSDALSALRSGEGQADASGDSRVLRAFNARTAGQETAAQDSAAVEEALRAIAHDLRAGSRVYLEQAQHVTREDIQSMTRPEGSSL